MKQLSRFLPIIRWLQHYDAATFRQDFLAAVVVTVMLVPQSLAYALLAGVPAQVGLYASMAPLVLYAVFGSSRSLSVGPVAVISLMTAATAAELAPAASEAYLLTVLMLTLLSGLMLFGMGLLRLGFIANLLSHSVVVGFISASAVLIALSQLKHLLGIQASGDNLPALLAGLSANWPHSHSLTAALGIGSLLFLYAVRHALPALLKRTPISTSFSLLLRRFAPILAVAATSALVWAGSWQQQGVAVVGHIPAGLPDWGLPENLWQLPWQKLWLGALLISLVGFVESVSVGQTLAAKRRERVEPNRELLGLGAANLGAALSGGMPVTGGFSRSVVNEDAGAQTPLAGVLTAIGMVAVLLWLTPALSYLPQAVLAATIIVAVLPLADYRAFRHTWRYDKADFAAMLLTALLTLLHSVESGIMAGVALSVLLQLYRSSRPHTAVIGRLNQSEHFRNVLRHPVATDPRVILMRIDESLYFPNVRFIEDRINQVVNESPQAQHLVLVCSAVNHIDTSALDSLTAINQRLQEAGIRFHLAEVKGPVYDKLAKIGFTRQISGDIFLSTFAAWQKLSTPDESTS